MALPSPAVYASNRRLASLIVLEGLLVYIYDVPFQPTLHALHLQPYESAMREAGQ